MATELPTYISISEAVEKYAVDRRKLTQLVNSGRVRAARVDGGVIVAEEDVNAISTLDLPNYVSISEAAKHHCLSREALAHLVETGKVRGIKINGNIAVVEEDLQGVSALVTTKRDELWAQAKHLDGKGIGVNEAASRYNLSTGSLTRWMKAGYIRILHRGSPKGGRGRKTYLNEADVAYAKLVSEERESRPGRQVFIKEFLPPFKSYS